MKANELKEIMSCKIILKYGYLPRLDFYTAEAKHKTVGGCFKDWKDDEKMEKCTKILLSRYPSLLKRNTSRENEVLMK